MGQTANSSFGVINVSEFPWFRFLGLLAIGATAVAGAIGATDPRNPWALPLLFFGLLCLLGAILDAIFWGIRKSRKRERPALTGPRIVASVQDPKPNIGKLLDRIVVGSMKSTAPPGQEWGHIGGEVIPDGMQYWQGKKVDRCPYCGHATTVPVGPSSLHDHLEQAHTEPPTAIEAERVYDVPMAWAKVPFHYIGDGLAFVPGVPCEPGVTKYTNRKRLDELMAYGLFAEGLAPASATEM
jgi:hypothetical protein